MFYIALDPRAISNVVDRRLLARAEDAGRRRDGHGESGAIG